MNTKTIAIAVVAILIIAGAGIFIYSNSNKESDGDLVTAAQIISRVNTDGSGIYMKVTYQDVTFFDSDNNPIKDAWDKKVFGTPGTASIQHVQLQEIVTSMGLKFVKYEESKSKTSGNVYYIDNIINADAATTKTASLLDGGILWEPQYSKIVADSQYFGLKTTNDLFPGHTCCVIAGSESFLKNNSDAATAFLAGYVEAVEWINKALEDKTEDYNTLIAICEKYTEGLTDDVIKEALSIVKYTYADDSTGSLAKLKEDVAELEESLTASGNILKPITSYGFNDTTEFANAFVNDTYLKNAISGGDDAKLTEKKTVTVSLIKGDIHQIAIRVGMDLGYFAKYNVDVDVHNLDKGPLVALEVIQGKTDIGFAGAPPMTINTVNTDGGIHR